LIRDALRLIKAEPEHTTCGVFPNGHAPEAIGHLDRSAVVRNHHNLRSLAQLTDRVTKAGDVCFVQGGIHFVENNERQWPNGQHAEQQRYAGECTLASGKEGELLSALERRASVNLNTWST
jgi:hypothetical protein